MLEFADVPALPAVTVPPLVRFPDTATMPAFSITRPLSVPALPTFKFVATSHIEFVPVTRTRFLAPSIGELLFIQPPIWPLALVTKAPFAMIRLLDQPGMAAASPDMLNAPATSNLVLAPVTVKILELLAPVV